MDNSSNIGDMLSKVLENPEVLKVAMSAAQGIMNSSSASGDTAPPPKESPVSSDSAETSSFNIEEVLKKGIGSSGGRDKVNLLLAIKPYLDGERGKRIDSAVNLLRLLELAKTSGMLNGIFH